MRNVVCLHFSSSIQAKSFNLFQDSIDEDKYRSVVSWTKYNLDERRKHFNDLFHLVKLNSLSKKFLNEVVHREVSLSECWIFYMNLFIMYLRYNIEH